MAYGGEALGRDDSGRVVFVPYGIAGEEVRVEIVGAKKEFARARLVEILTPSPQRVTPRCPHFGPRDAPVSANPRQGFARGCGGCQWQHIDYAAQLVFKRQVVRDQFARIAKLPDAPVASTRAGSSWNYRNHMRFALDDNGRMCLQAVESHDLIPIRECYIMDSGLVSTFSSLELEGADFDAVSLRTGDSAGDRMVIFEARDTTPPEIETDEPVSIVFQLTGARPGEGAVVTLIGKEAIEERIGARTFRISPRSFFQVNTPMAQVLLELVKEYLDPRPDDILLDAYSGVGLFGLSLAERVAHVVEIEESADALEDARHNAADLPEGRVEFLAGQVQEVLPRLKSQFTLAVVDPPRAGMAKWALDALASQAPRVIAYVSCDPATLARDARRLIDAGYRVTDIQSVDLFPQTFHVESVARFELALR